MFLWSVHLVISGYPRGTDQGLHNVNDLSIQYYCFEVRVEWHPTRRGTNQCPHNVSDVTIPHYCSEVRSEWHPTLWDTNQCPHNVSDFRVPHYCSEVRGEWHPTLLTVKKIFTEKFLSHVKLTTLSFLPVISQTLYQLSLPSIPKVKKCILALEPSFVKQDV